MAAEFNNGVLTEKGLALLAKWQAGECAPEITRAACGSGSYADGSDPAAQTALKNEQITTGFSKKTVQNESTLLLKIVFSNEKVTEGFSMTEIGIFAADPDEGEILYSIAVSADEANADYISAYNGEYPSNITFNYQIQVSNAGSVTFTPWDGVYATAEDLEELDEKVAALQPEISYYGVCDTDEDTGAKVVTVADSFALVTGATVRVKFTYANTTSAPTLNANGTGAVAMVMHGTTAMTTYHWQAGAVVAFTFDGTSWVAQQPGDASTAQYGVTKLTDGVTSTSVSTAATPNAVKKAYDTAVALQDRDALLEYICDSGVSSRNGIFRGADLTDVYTVAELHTKVSGGDFSNLYIGDYITVSITTSYGGTESVDLVIAAFDYFYRGGDNAGGLTTHHIVFVPKDNFSTTAAMNSSNTTEGGYAGSAMHTTVLPVYYTALNSALSSHILTHRRHLTTAVSTSAASAGGAGLTGSATTAAWADTNLCLMSEAMVYGGAVFSSSGRDIADACIQLPLFKLRPDYRIAMLGRGSTSRYTFWLCGVASSANFCHCSSYGHATYAGASNSGGVRPYFLFA